MKCRKCGQELTFVKDGRKPARAATEAIPQDELTETHVIVSGLSARSTEYKARRRHEAECQGREEGQ